MVNLIQKQTGNTNIDMSQFTKFPWLKQEYVDEIEERTKNVPEQYKDSMQQQMYSDYYQKQQIDEQQTQRSSIKNQTIQKSLDSSDPEEKKLLNKEVKKADLADLIRRKYNISTKAGNDDVIIDKFVSQVPNWTKLYGEYILWNNSDLLSKSWIISPIFAKLNEQNKVKTRNTKVVQQQQPQTSLISSSNFDSDEYARNYIQQQDASYDKFIEEAKKWGYSDWEIASAINANKQYQEYLKNVEKYEDRSLWEKIWVGGETPLWFAQWFGNFFINSYNNLLWNNPYVWIANPIEKLDASSWLRTDYDPTGEMRANSWWTKWWDIAWWITASIVTDQALLKLLPWMQAENLTVEWIKQVANQWWRQAVRQAVLDRTIQWAAEWWLWWFIDSVWQENATQSMKTWVPLWIVGGWIAWFTQWAITNRKAQQSLLDELDELKKANPDTENLVDVTKKSLRDKYRQWVRPLWQWKKSSAEYTKSIDDWIRGTETIVKNKNNLSFMDADWEIIEWQLPQNNQQFADAITQTKKSIYDQYHTMAQNAWEWGAKVSTKWAIEELTKLKNDKVALAWNDWLKWKIEKWIDDLTEIDGMSPEDAERKIAELNKKLEAFTKNWTSNDVSNDAINFLIKNQLKKSLDDWIDEVLWAWSEYQNLRKQYSYLRNIEKDVNQRALVQARRNGVWLVDSIANIESAEDFIKALAWSKENAWSFIVKQWLKKWIWWKNNPDNYIKSLFNEVDNLVNKPWNRADLYNKYGNQITEEVIEQAGWDLSKIELILWGVWNEVKDAIVENTEE